MHSRLAGKPHSLPSSFQGTAIKHRAQEQGPATACQHAPILEPDHHRLPPTIRYHYSKSPACLLNVKGTQVLSPGKRHQVLSHEWSLPPRHHPRFWQCAASREARGITDGE